MGRRRGSSREVCEGRRPMRAAAALRMLAAPAVIALLLVFAASALAVEGGLITGTVTSAATKAPIEGVEVCPERLIGGWPSCVKTNSGGEYTLETVWGGNFRVEFKAPAGSSYIRRTYYGEKYSYTEAAVVSVPEGGTTPGIDAEIAEGGRIGGTAIGASPKVPLEGLKVCAREPEHPRDLNDPEKNSGCTTTDSSGEYTVGGLPSGAYEVEFEVPYSSQLNFFTQFYDDEASWPEANLVSVTAGKTASGIDAELPDGGELSGRLTSSSTDAPIEKANVCASGKTENGYEGGCATTNANGEYTITRLRSAEYEVTFNAPGYVSEHLGSPGVTEATGDVSVTTGKMTSGADMSLEELPRIGGRVTNFSSKAPIKGIEVCVRPVSWTSNGPCATTNTNGEYSISDLEVREYTVEFSASGLNYLTQYYDGTIFSYDATRISLMPGTDAMNIDAALEEPGQISGKVTSSSTKVPLEGIQVCAGEPPEGNRTCDTTNVQGEYTISGLPGRVYYVEFDAGLVHYLTQFYADESSRSAAQPVTVTPGNTTSGVDAELVPINGGGLTGTVVSSETERPIEGIEVCAYQAGGEGLFGECAKTESRGEYTITGLSAGQYEVAFSSPANSGLNYVTQYYNNQSSASEATTVTVTAGSIDPLVDTRLREGGRITGVAMDASSKHAVGGIEVCAFDPQSEGIGCALTDADGEYTIAGLAHGEYIVEFFSPSENQLDYVTQFYDDKASFSEATPVSVEEGGTKSGIDAELEQGGQIAGEVTGVSTGAPLRDVLVCALSQSAKAEGCSVTNTSGTYTIPVLPAGVYRVGFDGGKNYITQYYNNKLSFSEAQEVPVAAGGTATGIDAAMGSSDAIPPANTKPPLISGTPALGERLLCADGLWTGSPTPTLTDRWLRDGAPIPGATAGSYTVQGADEGHGLSCEVTARSTAGTASAISAAVAIPVGPFVPTPVTSSAGPTTTVTTTITGPEPDLTSSLPLVSIVPSTIVVSGSSVPVHFNCSGATCRGSVELTMQLLIKRHEGKRTVPHRETLILAKGSFSLAKGDNVTAVLRLTTAGKQRLAQARRHPIAASLICSVQGGKTVTKAVMAS
jgi:hypothetical protein